MIKRALTLACLTFGFAPAPVVAQDLGDYLNQCLEAVTSRDPAAFGDLKAFIAMGEVGDEDVRRMFNLDADSTGITEISYAYTSIQYEPFPRPGADCSVTMVLNDAATEAAANFRKSFTKQYGPMTERPRDEYSAEVDEVVCLPTGFPLRLIISSQETSIRVSIWDSIPERPAC